MIGRRTRYATAETAAESGMVRTQAHTMRPATPHFTAETRRVAPTPMIAPVMGWGGDTGMPREGARKRGIAPAVSAQNPPKGCRLGILRPIVFTVRQPPN